MLYAGIDIHKTVFQALVLDPDTGLPGGLGLVEVPSFTMLMRENKDRMVFAKTSEGTKS